MKSIYTLLAICLLLATVSNAQLADGTIAPDWTMTDIEGVEHNLQSYLDDGYTVILDFSATWCGPCWAYHTGGTLEEIYANHGPAGMAGVSAYTTDDVMVFMIEGDGSTTTEDLNGTGTNTTGDWVTGTLYPIIDSDEITQTYAINFWPTMYTVCADGMIQESGQVTADEHLAIAQECAIQSLDVQLDDTSISSVQDAGDGNAFTFTLNNENDMNAEELVITVTSDAPADWTAEISAAGSSDGSSLQLMAEALSGTDVSLAVTPGTTAALANYTVEISSLTYPENVPITVDYFVASGITDLVVDNGGVSTVMNSDFVAGLVAAENTTHATLDIDKFTEAIMADQLSEMGHVYYNVGWTFPSFTDEGVEALKAFMDNGGNLMVVGQDVAWDTFNNEGTSITQEFMTSYLGVNYVGDGSASDSQMTFVSNDPLFGSLGNSSIENIYGGANIYPDQIDPIPGGFGILHYGNDETKFGGARIEHNGFKVVYIGVDLLMIEDEAVRTSTVEITHNWFHGLVSGVEESTISSLGSVYPNPSNSLININLKGFKKDSSIEVYSLLGELVFTENIANGSSAYVLNVSAFNNGLYTLRVLDSSGNTANTMVQVLK